MRIRTVTLAACAALLVPVAAAEAGTVTQSGGQLAFNGGAESNSPFFSPEDGNTLRISDSVAITALPGSCQRSGFYPDKEITCPMPSSLRVNLGEGKDDVGFWSDMPSSLPISVYGEGGDDILEDIANNVAGNTARRRRRQRQARRATTATTRCAAAPAPTSSTAHAGSDRLEGGDGDDTLERRHLQVAAPRRRRRRRRRRQGRRLGRSRAGDDHPPIDVSIDGQANDGRPGENDNVIARREVRADRRRLVQRRRRRRAVRDRLERVRDGRLLDARAATAATTVSAVTTRSRRSTAARATTCSRAATTTTRSPAGPAAT